MTTPFKLSLEPSQDKKSLRRQLQAERQSLVDRHQRSVHLQEVLRVWLVTRPEASVGAYWPIKGEFDALPALYRWSEAELRGIVANSKNTFDGSMMPSFYKTHGYIRPGDAFTGKAAEGDVLPPLLTAQQIEDTVAYLMTLKE